MNDKQSCPPAAVSPAMDQGGGERPYRPYAALLQLVRARVLEFYREPEAVFWVYGFPILMVLSLGIAFRSKPPEAVRVAVERGPAAATVTAALADKPTFQLHILEPAAWRNELRTAKIDLVVLPATSASDTAMTGWQPQNDMSTTATTSLTDISVTATTSLTVMSTTAPGSQSDAPLTATASDEKAKKAAAWGFRYVFDPARPESVLAQSLVDDALQRAAGRREVFTFQTVAWDEPGGRYIDFLVPGLLGMGIMGGGLWGVGFVTVDMRIRKLLKRFLATPMRKSEFLASLMISRLTFLVPEVLVLLVSAYFLFGVGIRGSVLSVLVLILVGALTFAGIGLLIASRATTMEAVSGLMNLVLLPMWVFSGVFFSSERFPEAAQPFIQALPLTALNNALRAVMLDGLSLWSQLGSLAILAAWGVGGFVLALRWFRWQ